MHYATAAKHNEPLEGREARERKDCVCGRVDEQSEESGIGSRRRSKRAEVRPRRAQLNICVSVAVQSPTLLPMPMVHWATAQRLLAGSST